MSEKYFYSLNHLCSFQRKKKHIACCSLNFDLLFGVSPGASIILAELAMEAGLPDGVLNIVHGTNV